MLKVICDLENNFLVIKKKVEIEKEKIISISTMLLLTIISFTWFLVIINTFHEFIASYAEINMALRKLGNIYEFVIKKRF